MFTTKELSQLLFALTVRADRISHVRDEERRLEEHGEEVGSPAYWNACLETMAVARARIEQELAIRDHAELVRINEHFRQRRAKAQNPPKSKQSRPELPADII